VLLRLAQRLAASPVLSFLAEETVYTALALTLAIKTTKRRGGQTPQKFLALNGKPVMQACWKQKMFIDVKKKKKRENRKSRATYGGLHMTHRHKLTRGLRSLWKAETARYPHAQQGIRS
jgi:hypothetical protein